MGVKMPLAFVLVNVEAGTDREVLDNIKKVPEVKQAYMVYGVYDIVAKVESESLEELRDVVSRQIRRLEGVRSTVTLIVVSQLLV